jgi:HEPN domain-containing protein
MLDPEDLLTWTRKWVQKAEHDLQAAALALPLGDEGPTDTTCFHAQQCVEKYLKAFLLNRGVLFPKTHDLHTLMALVPAEIRLSLDKTMQERMTEYATVRRYPDEVADPTFAQARKAVAAARRVRKEVRRLLPRAALRRKKA